MIVCDCVSVLVLVSLCMRTHVMCVNMHTVQLCKRMHVMHVWVCTHTENLCAGMHRCACNVCLCTHITVGARDGAGWLVLVMQVCEQPSLFDARHAELGHTHIEESSPGQADQLDEHARCFLVSSPHLANLCPCSVPSSATLWAHRWPALRVERHEIRSHWE